MKKSINTKKYIENYLKIQDKKSRLSNLSFNTAQERLYNVIKEMREQGKPVRIITLKARQMGVSTISGAIIFKDSATKFNRRSGVVAHDNESTSKIFGMYKLYYEQLPEYMKPSMKRNNAKLLEFDNETGTGLKSSIRCMTAGTSGVGRGSTFNNLHISEFAFWDGDKMETYTSLVQAVPNTPDSMIIIESTANGYDEFQDLWQKAVNGENDFYPLFIPWFEMNEYSMSAYGIELSEQEKEIKAKFNLTNEQMAWRRWCIKNNCGGNESKFRQEYPATPEEAFITTGDCYFNTEQIIERAKEVAPPSRKGSFVYDKTINGYGETKLNNVRFVDDEKGMISIYKEPDSESLYVIGGDTAGDGKDAFTGQVINNKTLEQVAELHKVNCAEDYYAEQLVCLSRYYNNALLAIEVNYNPYIIKLVTNLGYDNLYIRETANDTMYTGYSDKYGFRTTATTRPAILSEFRMVFNDNPRIINSKMLLGEMQTFMVSAGGKPEALNGRHDDLVMAMAIAYGTRHQQGIKRTGTARVGSLRF